MASLDPRQGFRGRGSSFAKESQSHPWLVDDYANSYVQWREECEAVRAAYGLWHIAAVQDRGWAFALYDAALDHEEETARDL